MVYSKHVGKYYITFFKKIVVLKKESYFPLVTAVESLIPVFPKKREPTFIKMLIKISIIYKVFELSKTNIKTELIIERTKAELPTEIFNFRKGVFSFLYLVFASNIPVKMASRKTISNNRYAILIIISIVVSVFSIRMNLTTNNSKSVGTYD
ncbi:MAG: hypothetical protein ACTSSL_11720 [Candidatus Heimdallarchaeaceae archaeon]